MLRRNLCVYLCVCVCVVSRGGHWSKLRRVGDIAWGENRPPFAPRTRTLTISICVLVFVGVTSKCVCASDRKLDTDCPRSASDEPHETLPGETLALGAPSPCKNAENSPPSILRHSTTSLSLDTLLASFFSSFFYHIFVLVFSLPLHCKRRPIRSPLWPWNT